MEDARAAHATRFQRYYTPYEVAVHNTPQDCWVSFLGGVYDLTELVKAHTGALIGPIISNAGRDISHWFDHDTGDVKMRMCPGRFVGVAPDEPISQWDCTKLPWWQDAKAYRVGLLSRSVRPVRVRNVLTGQEDVMELPEEETIGEIRRRYLALNAHAASYAWKALRPRACGAAGKVTAKAMSQVTEAEKGSNEASTSGRGTCGGSGSSSSGAVHAACSGPQGQVECDSDMQFVELDMNKTLVQNGVVDERKTFEELGLQPDWYMPVLHLHWIDDLTVA